MSEVLTMPTSMPVPQQSETAMLIHMYERVIRDPGVDLERVQRVREMLREERALAAQTAYKADLAELQGELPAIVRRGRIDIGRGKPQTYATLEDVVATVRAPMHKWGFSFEFHTTYPEAGKMAITTILNHRLGHHTESTRILPFDTTGSKNAVQSHGSSESYGRRYGILAALNLATTGEDDDGKAAGVPINNGPSILIEQLGTIQMELVQGGVPIDWLLEFLQKRGLQVSRLEDIPRTYFEKVVAAIKGKTAQDERSRTASSGQ
jgi:hypothetical protein